MRGNSSVLKINKQSRTFAARIHSSLNTFALNRAIYKLYMMLEKWIFNALIEMYRVANFCTFPVTVVGNESLNSQYRGTLKYEICYEKKKPQKSIIICKSLLTKKGIECTLSLQKSFKSSLDNWLWLGFRRTHAHNSFPILASVTPITFELIFNSTLGQQL